MLRWLCTVTRAEGWDRQGRLIKHTAPLHPLQHLHCSTELLPAIYGPTRHMHQPQTRGSVTLNPRCPSPGRRGHELWVLGTEGRWEAHSRAAGPRRREKPWDFRVKRPGEEQCFSWGGNSFPPTPVAPFSKSREAAGSSWMRARSWRSTRASPFAYK